MHRSICAIAAIFIIAGSLWAGDVSLAWDPSPSEGVTGYKIYNRDYSHGYEPSSLWNGNQISCTVQVEFDRQTAFVATAYDSIGNESGYSNEVIFVPESNPPGKPEITIRSLP